MKDLGVLKFKNKSRSLHAEKRAETAIKALYTFKRNISNATLVNRKNAYVCFVVPVVSHALVLGMPNKGDIRLIKNVQQKAVAWILRPNGLFHKKLVTLDILPHTENST